MVSINGIATVHCCYNYIWHLSELYACFRIFNLFKYEGSMSLISLILQQSPVRVGGLVASAAPWREVRTHGRMDKCPGSRDRDDGRGLGFPSDLIGARSPPHLASLLSSLWNLPTHEKKVSEEGGSLLRFVLCQLGRVASSGNRCLKAFEEEIDGAEGPKT
jgi:hypothetical protein